LRGSNIVDLIHDLSRERKTQKAPQGLQEFVKVLRSANLPLEYIVNKNRRSMFNELPESDTEYFDTSQVNDNLIGLWRE
jgi:hypothetical protein